MIFTMVVKKLNWKNKYRNNWKNINPDINIKDWFNSLENPFNFDNFRTDKININNNIGINDRLKNKPNDKTKPEISEYGNLSSLSDLINKYIDNIENTGIIISSMGINKA